MFFFDIGLKTKYPLINLKKKKFNSKKNSFNQKQILIVTNISLH